jgi:hypothetical protein
VYPERNISLSPATARVVHDLADPSDAADARPRAPPAALGAPFTLATCNDSEEWSFHDFAFGLGLQATQSLSQWRESLSFIGVPSAPRTARVSLAGLPQKCDAGRPSIDRTQLTQAPAAQEAPALSAAASVYQQRLELPALTRLPLMFARAFVDSKRVEGSVKHHGYVLLWLRSSDASQSTAGPGPGPAAAALSAPRGPAAAAVHWTRCYCVLLDSRLVFYPSHLADPNSPTCAFPLTAFLEASLHPSFSQPADPPSVASRSSIASGPWPDCGSAGRSKLADLERAYLPSRVLAGNGDVKITRRISHGGLVTLREQRANKLLDMQSQVRIAGVQPIAPASTHSNPRVTREGSVAVFDREMDVRPRAQAIITKPPASTSLVLSSMPDPPAPSATGPLFDEHDWSSEELEASGEFSPPALTTADFIGPQAPQPVLRAQFRRAVDRESTFGLPPLARASSAPGFGLQSCLLATRAPLDAAQWVTALMSQAALRQAQAREEATRRPFEQLLGPIGKAGLLWRRAKNTLGFSKWAREFVVLAGVELQFFESAKADPARPLATYYLCTG